MTDSLPTNGAAQPAPTGQKVVAVMDIVFACLGMLCALGLLVSALAALFELPELSGVSAVAILWTQIALTMILSGFLFLAGIGMLSNTAKWGGIFAILFAITRLLVLVLQLVVLGIVFYHARDSREVVIGVLIAGVCCLFPFVLCILNFLYGIKVVRRDSAVAMLPFRPISGPTTAVSTEIRDDATKPFTRTSEQLSVQEIRNNKIVREHKLECCDPFGDPVRNTVGRRNDSAIRIISDPYVSDHHCFLTKDAHGNHMLGDLGSSHGTFLLRSQRRTRVTSLTPVFSGDRIVVGNTHLIVHMLSSQI
jgi:hypothetical protein